MNPSGARPLAGVAVGDELPPLTVHVDRARLVEYAAASGDRNRIHWDERFATGVGLPDVIAHGMFTMGAAIDVVAAWAGGADCVVEYGCKFIAPVVVPHDVGADIEVTAKVAAIEEAMARARIDLTVACGGAKVLGRAFAVVTLDTADRG